MLHSIFIKNFSLRLNSQIRSLQRPSYVLQSKNLSCSFDFHHKYVYGGFSKRHIGPSQIAQDKMLKVLKLQNLDELINFAIPSSIISTKNYTKVLPLSEPECLEKIKEFGENNKLHNSFIGMGFYNTHIPSVILRNVLENPGWYTAYTPYQAEISQGRLESLFNFQTMITEITGLPISNCSLLDGASACSEAIFLAHSFTKRKEIVVLGTKMMGESSPSIFPQDYAAIETRAKVLNLHIKILSIEEALMYDYQDACCLLVQYPNTFGVFEDFKEVVDKAKTQGAVTVSSVDLLALSLFKSPKELGFDVAVGNAQRFGVPLGYGGPHPAFMAVEKHLVRFIPGRIIGLSKDSNGKPAFRLALQVREQHIRREKATSNICTAQALLANMSAMYAVYHGPNVIKNIASSVHKYAVKLRAFAKQLGYKTNEGVIFDTVILQMTGDNIKKVKRNSLKLGLNFRYIGDTKVGISFDETITDKGFCDVLASLGITETEIELPDDDITVEFARNTPYLNKKIFNTYHSETEMMRYIKSLEMRDISLVHSMITLGSCTMKLNAATELRHLTNANFTDVHPYAPHEQTRGFRNLIDQLGIYLVNITGMDNCSFHANSGAQGEYLGLLTIKRYLEHKGQSHRNICFVASSAHGTNPSSARLAGFNVVTIGASKNGGVDLEDLKEKTSLHRDSLACAMFTFPSTYGIFEEEIIEICKIIKDAGGQFYMDGANMNAQVGICRPAEFGVDVMHLNLHKTFSIPHGGGGPGMGPICYKSHLAPFVPNIRDFKEMVSGVAKNKYTGSILSSFTGSSLVLPISWSYISMMGDCGLKKASQIAILNANYAQKRLEDDYKILFCNKNGLVAHEFIIDCRPFKSTTGVEAVDVAKRLIDYGFHPPTMSFPVVNTLMIEPTESESKEELDRFCDSLISIRKEIDRIECGDLPKDLNMLKCAPHDIHTVTGTNWDRPYTREEAAFPMAHLRSRKVWPYVSRVDDVYGDRNLVTSHDE